MNTNHLAILVYGALTLIFAFAFAKASGSATAMALLILATGLTYAFQVVQEFTDSKIVLILWAAVIALFIAAMGFAWERFL